MDRRIWSAVALFASLLSLLVMIGFVIVYEKRASRRDVERAAEIADLKARVEEREKDHEQIVTRCEDQSRLIDAWRGWGIATYERLSARGWNLPPLPPSENE